MTRGGHQTVRPTLLCVDATVDALGKEELQRLPPTTARHPLWGDRHSGIAEHYSRRHSMRNVWPVLESGMSRQRLASSPTRQSCVVVLTWPRASGQLLVSVQQLSYGILAAVLPGFSSHVATYL
eukprot:scaffold148_cov371-Prasinococcus_capsulatus_cf.AAC.22